MRARRNTLRPMSLAAYRLAVLDGISRYRELTPDEQREVVTQAQRVRAYEKRRTRYATDASYRDSELERRAALRAG